MVVLSVDECHLTAIDICGYGWGPQAQRVTVPIANVRDRQTYYGAVDAVSGQLIVVPFDVGNTDWTLVFLIYLQEQYPGKRLIICWDGASYHRSGAIQEYLEGINHGYAREQWPLTLIQFAPHAPEQNPIETVWLQAKTTLRRTAARCQATFQSITDAFADAINGLTCDFAKLRMYLPDLQLT